MAYGKKKKKREEEEKVVKKEKVVKVTNMAGEVVMTFSSKENGKDYLEIAKSYARDLGGEVIK